MRADGKVLPGMRRRERHTTNAREARCKVVLRLEHCKSAVPESSGFGKIYQKGLSTTISTIRIIKSAGTSFMIRQWRVLPGRSSRPKALVARP